MKKFYYFAFCILMVSACSELRIDEAVHETPPSDSISAAYLTEKEDGENTGLSTPKPTVNLEALPHTDSKEKDQIEEENDEKMPKDLRYLIDNSDKWSSLAQYQFNPENTKIIYTYNFEIHLYDIALQKDELLMSVYPDTLDISGFHWNPSETKIAFVVYNSPHSHTDYPKGSKVFVLTFENGRQVKKDKYNIDIPIGIPCSNQGCFPYNFGFIDENTLHYFTSKSGGNIDWTIENHEKEIVEKFLKV